RAAGRELPLGDGEGGEERDGAVLHECPCRADRGGDADGVAQATSGAAGRLGRARWHRAERDGPSGDGGEERGNGEGQAPPNPCPEGGEHRGDGERCGEGHAEERHRETTP